MAGVWPRGTGRHPSRLPRLSLPSAGSLLTVTDQESRTCVLRSSGPGDRAGHACRVIPPGPISCYVACGLAGTPMKSDLSKWRAFVMRVCAAAREAELLRAAWPLLVALSAILVTSGALLVVDRFLDAKSLIFVYLLPTVVMAMHYGSTAAVLTSFASGLAGAYFFFPPKFSF